MFNNRGCCNHENSFHALFDNLRIILFEYHSIQISQWMNMAHPTWFMFANNDMGMEEFFIEIRVPLNSLFLISVDNDNYFTIEEVYKIGRDRQLRSISLGTWDSINKLNVTKKSHYECRHNLFGYNLKVLSIHVSFHSRELPNQEYHALNIQPYTG